MTNPDKEPLPASATASPVAFGGNLIALFVAGLLTVLTGGIMLFFGQMPSLSASTPSAATAPVAQGAAGGTAK